MELIEISRPLKLNGKVKIQGSKNSSLALMAAACLSNGPVILDNIPDILDVHTFINIIRDIGGKAGFIGKNQIIIDLKSAGDIFISPIHTKKVRPAYYFIGALLSNHKKITIGNAGGDRIGKRPIDQHVKGLEAMGAHFEFHDDYYTVTCDRLAGNEVYFDIITGGATLNVMMAAVKAEGTTTIYNAARDPEVVDTAILLNKMGAKIHGAGTHTIRIEGVKRLHGCSHAVIPDRLIAGTYLMAAGIAGGRVTVENVIPEHVLPLIHKLREAGMEFIVKDNSITAISDGNIKPVKIIAEKYPMFETDYQQPATVLLLKANGESTIIDKIYPERANHCEQLSKMGANIKWSAGTFTIASSKELVGTHVEATDIRAGTSLLLAGLMAEGKTYISGVDHIKRGFTDVIGDFTQLGVDIRFINNEGKSVKKVEECLQKNAEMK